MEGNSIKTFENLCKIFEMRIKLDNVKGEKTSPEVSENYLCFITLLRSPPKVGVCTLLGTTGATCKGT